MTLAQRFLYAIADIFCGTPADELPEPMSEEREAQLGVFEKLLIILTALIGILVTGEFVYTFFIF